MSDGEGLTVPGRGSTLRLVSKGSLLSVRKDLLRNFSLFLASITFLVAAGGLIPTGCTATPNESPPTPQLQIGQEVEIEGTVLENVRGCVRDLPCFLRLQTDAGAVNVVYAAGLGPTCPNAEAADAGMKIRKGTRVRVFARATSKSELSTCADVRYFIKSLPQ